jgi:hypothetical protein
MFALTKWYLDLVTDDTASAWLAVNSSLPGEIPVTTRMVGRVYLGRGIGGKGRKLSLRSEGRAISENATGWPVCRVALRVPPIPADATRRSGSEGPIQTANPWDQLIVDTSWHAAGYSNGTVRRLHNLRGGAAPRGGRGIRRSGRRCG